MACDVAFDVACASACELAANALGAPASTDKASAGTATARPRSTCARWEGGMASHPICNRGVAFRHSGRSRHWLPAAEGDRVSASRGLEPRCPLRIDALHLELPEPGAVIRPPPP